QRGRARRRRDDPACEHPLVQSDPREGGSMSQDIVDAVKALEQEKGIDADTLMDALSDALLSAYKKTPGAAKYAKVELDHNTADFRVHELILPDGLEEKLLDEQFAERLDAAEAAEAAGEPIDQSIPPPPPAAP